MNALSRKDTASKLEPIASSVARYLALGLTHEDVVVETGLSLENVKKVARGNLVQKRIRELQVEIDEKLTEQAAENPVQAYLKVKSRDAATRLVEEIDNFDEDTGATASTRIKASTTVLEMAGHKQNSDREATAPIINISANKVEIGQSIIESNVKTMPDFVDG